MTVELVRQQIVLMTVPIAILSVSVITLPKLSLEQPLPKDQFFLWHLNCAHPPR